MANMSSIFWVALIALGNLVYNETANFERVELMVYGDHDFLYEVRILAKNFFMMYFISVNVLPTFCLS